MFRKNVDSGIGVQAKIWDEVAGRLSYLSTTYAQVPIYYVRPDTMDEIEPPRKGFDRKCVRETIKRIEKRSAEEERDRRPRWWETDDFDRAVEETKKRLRNSLEERWSNLSECRRVKYCAVGVYTDDVGVIREHTGENEERAIFICPERIFKPEYAQPDIIFQHVVIHELAHAYHGVTENYNKDWGEVIEESLATAVAYLHFKNHEINPIMEFIAQQPCEYQGFTFWLYQPEIVPSSLNLWKNNRLPLYPIPICYERPIRDYFPEWRYILREIFHFLPSRYFDKVLLYLPLLITHPFMGIYTHTSIFLHDPLLLIGLLEEYAGGNYENLYKLLAMEILREGTA